MIKFKYTFITLDLYVFFFLMYFKIYLGFPGGSVGKESTCNVGDPGLTPGWGRKWQPTPTLLPGEFHGERSLAGYSP